MNSLDVSKLSINPSELWDGRWLILTAGTMDDCNMMTVSWGSTGWIWDKPFAQVFVRPSRHTYGYTEKLDSFTLCAFPKEYRPDLQTMGSISGRDGDKVAKTKLSLKASSVVAAPCYNEADFTLECKPFYRQEMTPAGFLDNGIEKHYPGARDYHISYFGEIVAAFQG